jgi:hypothetical protein
VVEANSLAVTIKAIARTTMQPLPRYGKPRFIELTRSVRIRMDRPFPNHGVKLPIMPTQKNSENHPKEGP